jgi:hypothetical protein
MYESSMLEPGLSEFYSRYKFCSFWSPNSLELTHFLSHRVFFVESNVTKNVSRCRIFLIELQLLYNTDKCNLFYQLNIFKSLNYLFIKIVDLYEKKHLKNRIHRFSLYLQWIRKRIQPILQYEVLLLV